MEDFESALEAVLPRLRRFAHGLARNPADADDLTQATAERALRSRAQFQPGTSIVGWSMRIMRNLWIDTARAKSRRDKVLAPAEQGETVGEEGAAESHVELHYVMRALGHLPDEQREAVALVMIEGLAYREAAEVLDVPIGTLTSRLVRGRQALLGLLGEE
ncbi:MAG TPA: sigma-70 family RNA polymerase sigma factor [Sphingomonas sp.]|nr:sigma-70 family RNA polymerase sigma factor [Sphingomonas sp.]